MAELEEKLNAILGNPEAMGQIVSIAKALTGEGGEEPPPAPQDSGPAPSEYSPVEPAETVSEPASSPDGSGPDWGSIMALLSGFSGGGGGAAANPLGALGNLDPKLIQAAVTLFSEYSATDDRKIALLAALKPFLKEERYAKMDKAIQIAKLSRVIRVAFQLFKKEGGEETV